MVRSNLHYRSSALKPHTKKLKDKLYKMYKKEQHVMSHITFTILKVYLICYIILIGRHYSTEEIYVDCQCYIKLHTFGCYRPKPVSSSTDNNHHTQFFTFRPSVHVLITTNTSTAFFLTQRHCGTPFHTRWYQQPLCLLTVQVSID